jgi:ribosomal small subunit protein bTHX
MGKGDKKSKKGKRFKGSFGNSRKRTAIKARLKRSVMTKATAEVPALAVAEEKPKAKRTNKKKATE